MGSNKRSVLPIQLSVRRVNRANAPLARRHRNPVGIDGVVAVWVVAGARGPRIPGRDSRPVGVVAGARGRTNPVGNRAQTRSGFGRSRFGARAYGAAYSPVEIRVQSGRRRRGPHKRGRDSDPVGIRIGRDSRGIRARPGRDSLAQTPVGIRPGRDSADSRGSGRDSRAHKPRSGFGRVRSGFARAQTPVGIRPVGIRHKPRSGFGPGANPGRDSARGDHRSARRARTAMPSTTSTSAISTATSAVT